MPSAELWERAKAIVADALEISSVAVREAFVGQECGDDFALRAEVESLLSQTTTGFDQVVKEASNRDTPLTAGRRIDRYEIIRELGRGGMGAVYLAKRADGEFDKQVAIKLLKRGTDTDEILRHFSAERQILARLEHPNIARLLDAGTTSDGLPYFVMEYVEGVPITSYITTLGLSERLKLFQAVCSALSYAHRNLVIHRDLKPGNVLVTKEGEVKLLDFGIAKLVQATEQSQPQVTMTMFRVMTPEYASPEQLSGAPITTQSDVYSLGVLFYELLTGSRPYRLKTRKPEEIAQAITKHEPQRPSTTTREGSEPAVIAGKALRGDLDNIVLKALRKEPERRYASVDEFSDDIRRHLAGLPVRARKDTTAYRARKFIRRHKTGVAAAAIVVLALIAGVISTTWQARRAEKRFNQVRSLAHSVLFNYHDKIAALPGSTAVREQLVKDALSYLNNLASEAGNDKGLLRELASAYEKVGQIQGNSYYVNLGDATGAMASYKKSLAIRDRLLAAEPRSVELQEGDADSHEGVGDMYYTIGDLPAGLASYERASNLRQSVTRASPDNTDYRLELSQLYTKLGDIKGMEGYDNLGDPVGAVDYYRKAQDLLESLVATNPADLVIRGRRAEVLCHLGMLYDVTGNVAAALAIGGQAIAELEQLAATEPNNSDHHYLLLAAYASQRYSLVDNNQLAEAIAQSRKVIADLETMAARDPKDVRMRRNISVTYNALGIDLLKQGDIPAAVQQHEKALAISQDILEKNPESEESRADVAFTLRRLGEAQAASGDNQSALNNYRQALSLRQSSATADPSNARARDEMSAVYADLGKALALTGATSEGVEDLEKAIALAEELSRTAPTNAKYRASLARRYHEAGRLAVPPAQAHGYLTHSLAIWNELRDKGTLVPADIGEADGVERQLKQFETSPQ